MGDEDAFDIVSLSSGSLGVAGAWMEESRDVPA